MVRPTPNPASMARNGQKVFVFSSTAAIFGEPEYTPIDERHPQKPINPYGKSKLMVEQALADFDTAYDGELCAGEPHAQFGGRGGCQSFPTPIIDPTETLRFETSELFLNLPMP